MATIKDIAEMTGVSAATVSNVLNGKPGAASSAKQHEILKTAQKLNYTPNLLAKGLKQRKSNSIGVITEDLTAFCTPEIVDGIDAVCEESGYDIMLANMRMIKREEGCNDGKAYGFLLNRMTRYLLSKQVEGIIFVGHHFRKIPYAPPQVDIPFVYAYSCPSPGEKNASVVYDDEKAAYDVTKILIEKGHRKIGILGGPESSVHTQARLKGHQNAMAECGIAMDESLVIYGNWDRDSGYWRADIFIDKGATAVFAFNDVMAGGVYERCFERGLKPGTDISVFGFDNREISRGYTPKIATVELPLYQIGRKSAELVIDELGMRLKTDKRIMLPCTVMERGSIGKRK